MIMRKYPNFRYAPAFKPVKHLKYCISPGGGCKLPLDRNNGSIGIIFILDLGDNDEKDINGIFNDRSYVHRIIC